jgi:hypothetical protein
MKSYLHVLGCGCLVGAVILCFVIAFRESHPEFSSIAATGLVCLWVLLTTGLGLLAAGYFLPQAYPETFGPNIETKARRGHHACMVDEECTPSREKAPSSAQMPLACQRLPARSTGKPVAPSGQLSG